MFYRTKIYVVFFFLLTVFSGCATTTKTDFKNLFAEDIAYNRQAIQQGNMPRAIGELSMLLEMDPTNQEALFLRALAHQKMGQFTKSAQDYEQLLNLNINHSKAHYNLGMIYAFKTYNRKLAIKHLDKFISLKPKHPNAYSAAKVMLQLANQNKRSAELDEELQNTIEDVLTNRTLIRIETEKDINKKKKLLEKSLKLSPNDEKMHFAFGKLLEQEGKTSEAINSYKKALSLQPTLADCHLRLGQLLAQNKKKREAEIHFLKASLFAAK